MALRAATFVTLDQVKAWCKHTPAESKAVDGITRDGSTATMVVRAHGWRHGDSVLISGAVETAYNGTATVSIVDADTVTFTVSGTPSSPATGSNIRARGNDDAVLTLLADRAAADIERETGRAFLARAVTETITANGGRSIPLRYFPIIGDVTLTVESLAIESTRFTTDAQRGFVTLIAERFPRTPGGVVAAYQAGYATVADVPADAIGLCLEMTKLLCDRWQAGALMVSSLSMGPAGLNVREGYPSDIRRALSQMRDTRFG